VGVDVASSLTGWWPWIAGSLAVVVGFEIVSHWLRKTVEGLRHRWIARRALRGEAHAEVLLERAGYEIIGRQVERSYTVHIDERATRVVVRADLLVQDSRGRVLVAEVKTGREAPRIENSATRRQLLEYRVGFDVSGVLLVDAGADTIHRVHFPLREEPRTTSNGLAGVRALLWAVALGIAGTIGLVLASGRLDLSLP